MSATSTEKLFKRRSSCSVVKGGEGKRKKYGREKIEGRMVRGEEGEESRVWERELTRDERKDMGWEGKGDQIRMKSETEGREEGEWSK